MQIEKPCTHIHIRFEKSYRCFPVSFHNKGNLENGDKIVLPPSALDMLARLQIEYPMLFKLSHVTRQGTHVTHCGVMEFSAQEGRCYIPYWMMQNLLLKEGSIVKVKNISLKKATYVKFRPQTKDFLDISNPKAVLEKSLRTYSCMTKGDQICIPYNDKKYYIDVLEVRPNGVASIIETDVSIDFAPPADYVEPTPKDAVSAPAPPTKEEEEAKEEDGVSVVSNGKEVKKKVKDIAALERGEHKNKKQEEEEASKPIAFTGKGHRLDGKPLKKRQLMESSSGPKNNSELKKLAEARRKRMAAAAEARRKRNAAKQMKTTERKNRSREVAFGGSGRTLESS
jgi:ubiquitin fusion degradation protein 1